MDHSVQDTRDLNITGNAQSHGGQFRKVRITGESIIQGNLECSRMRVVGQIQVLGNVQSDEVKVVGQMSVQGNCSCESFHARGAFSIGGLLNAGDISVKLFGPCEAKEIGCEHIAVRRTLRGFGDHKRLTVDVIEGDDIHLESTRANVVRGKRVVIGPRCEIGLVEYQDEFRESAQSHVGESRQVR